MIFHDSPLGQLKKINQPQKVTLRIYTGAKG